MGRESSAYARLELPTLGAALSQDRDEEGRREISLAKTPRRQDAEGEFGGSEIFLLFASAALADIISLITTIRFGAGAAVLEIVRQQGRKR